MTRNVNFWCLTPAAVAVLENIGEISETFVRKGGENLLKDYFGYDYYLAVNENLEMGWQRHGQEGRLRKKKKDSFFGCHNRSISVNICPLNCLSKS